jgi:membrane protein YdbS with pleckstrin-like domain
MIWNISEKEGGEKLNNNSEHELKTKHGFYDCVYWCLFLAIPFITACTAIVKNSTVWVVVYILGTILFFAVVVFKFFCTHCPHYLQGDKTVKCMFIRWVPKYFQPKPGPYSFLELAIVAMATLVWVAFPLYWLHFRHGLLAIYVISLVVFVATMKRYECGRCIHFHCPANNVSEEIRGRFSEAENHQAGGLS